MIPILLLFVLLSQTLCADPTPKLLVVAYDGLRWDYIDRMPHLSDIAQKGARSLYGLELNMVTYTTALFHTLNTGLYEENHGITGNKMIDVDEQNSTKSFYDYWNLSPHLGLNGFKNARDSHWYRGEPIWQANDAIDGRKSGSMHWPMGDATVNGKTAAFYEVWPGYDDLEQWTKSFDKLMGWFLRDNDPINFGLLYVPEPDHTQHGNSIYSEEVAKKIKEVDFLSDYIIKRVELLKLTESLNIVFLADHGHTEIHLSEAIDLDLHIEPTGYKLIDYNVFPNAKMGVTASSLYDQLVSISTQRETAKFHVYCRDHKEIPQCIYELPDRFHYKHGPYVGPIILSPAASSYIYKSSDTPDGLPKKTSVGNHGYSPEYPEMRPVFLGVGPAFKKNYTLEEPPQNVDVFSLFCGILQIEDCPANDGQFDRIKNMLADQDIDSAASEVFSRSIPPVLTILLSLCAMWW